MMEKIIALKYLTEKEVRSTKKGLRLFTRKRGLKVTVTITKTVEMLF